LVGGLVAAGCAVGIVGDPGGETDGSVSEADGGPADAPTTTRPDSGGPKDAIADSPSPVDVVVPPVDSGGDAGGCTGAIVINEVQTEGTDANHEFVEIYNPTPCDVSLEGYTLKYSSTTSSTPSTFFTGLLSHRVLARGYFVVASSTYPGAKNATYTGGTMAADDGQVGLFDKLGARVDAVGYGSISGSKPLTEGNPAPTPGTVGRSVQRIPNGTDTNNNQVDFRSAVATPNGPN
jgi:hypothetical protein